MGRPNARTEITIKQLVQWTPKQQQAVDACFSHRFILYGGARGGGKSRWLRWVLVFMLAYWSKFYGLRKIRVGLFCATYPELRDRQISKISAEFPAWLGEIKDTKEDGLCFFMKPAYGSGIIALRNLDDPDKYKSAEFAIVAVDELTLVPSKETFDILRGSLRWPGIPEGHTLFLAATNPDGVGNLWVRTLWIERLFPPEMQQISEQFTFIQALPADNPHLDQQYWNDLRSQPPDVQRAWIEGDWYVFTGQVFQLRPGVHIVTPFEIPEHWIRKAGTDWGYAKPFANLWGAQNPDNGRIVVYREAYETQLSDPRQAELIRNMEAPGEKVRIRYADPSMWAKKTQTNTPTSSADTYAAHGIYLTPAVNDRLNGKRKVDKLLAPMADGSPGLLIFLTCVNSARTIPSLVYDKTHYEDVNTDGEDHAYDALRYLLTDARDAAKKSAPQKNPFYK
jgi:hypothetical protein